MAETYYYAANERVRIDPDPDHVAVDFSRSENVSPRLSRWLAQHRSVSPLRGELRLFNRTEIPKSLLAELEAKSAVQPVYRNQDTLLVVLPEVRVEGTSKAQQERIRTFVEKGDLEAAVEPRDGRNLILRLASGRGADALALANTLYENLRPSMAQARFLRVVPSPALSKG